MKKLLFYVLLYIATTVSAQITHSFTSQLSNYQITSEQTYKIVTNQQTNVFTTQVGAPQLPVFTKNFVLPAGSTVTNISVNNQNQVLMASNIFVYPTQPPRDWVSEPAFVSPTAAIYNSSNIYPTNTVVKTGDGASQGYHIVTLDICPFKYIPAEKKLYLYQTVNINIQYTIGSIIKTEKISLRRHEMTKEWVASQVVNPELLNSTQPTAKIVLDQPIETDKLVLHWKPSAYGDFPEYIIITNEALKPIFQQLADYKTKRGFPTLVVTTEQIYPVFAGVDNAEKIRNYLKAAHKNWGAGLFILLAGDSNIIPGRIASYDHESTDGPSPSDLYYSDVYRPDIPNYNWNQNGNARFGETGDGIETGLSADNYIGRAPVDTEQEALNFINKIINYEKLNGLTNQSQKSYVNNMLFLGAYFSYNHGSETGSPGGQMWHDDLADEPFLLDNPNLKNWQLYDHKDGPPKHNYPGNEELNRENTIYRMNNGASGIGKFHLVSHFDHGGAFGLGVSGRMKYSSLYRENMDALSNGNYLQIMYSTACLSSKFTLDAIGEHYINNQNGGGVAYIGNTESVYTGAVLQDKKLFQSIYEQSNTDAYLMGVAFANARDAMNDMQRRKVLTLFGDPTMMTWSVTPGTITLSTPTSITINNSSDNTLTVGINALTQDAIITLYKYNALGYPEIFSWQKISAGGTSTQFNLNPDTPGTLLVTATAKNYILPVPKNVNVLMPQPHLYVTGFTFTDGNGNHLIEPGENITLTVSLKNSGGASINNITTLLSCPSELATVTNPGVNHSPTINAGQTITLSGFTFTPLVEMGVDEIPDFIEFHLNINASNNYNHLDNFYLDIHSPKLNLGARNLTDNFGNPVTTFIPNQIVNAKIAINNTGNIATGELSAVLSSPLVNMGIIQITEPIGNYPDIPVYDEKANFNPFKFKLLQPHTGTMPFKLTLSNAFGQSWEFNFDMRENCPGAISGFNFNSGPDWVNLMWNPVGGIGGYNIYRSNTENGTYIRMNDFLITGTASFTDYEVQEATEYYYKISVVSLSGNECPLENILTPDNKQGYLAWTSLETHGGFPIPAYARSGISSPTLYDIDGDGTKEIFINYRQGGDNAGLIMGFHHDGEEIFDIDGNPTTISGFAVTDAGMWANSAVGDIDGDGYADVVSVSRDNDSNRGKLYAYKTIDENNDNKPDKFWEDEIIDFGHRIGKNPVLFDLNNDGFLEIIVANENQKVYVYDKDKNLISGWPIQIPGGNDWSYGHIAVADLDNDGFGEIAFGVEMQNGTKGAIYIWNHDGTPFTTNPFKEFANNERADSGITFADIDNDGQLELLTTTKTSNTNAKIYAFKLNGNPVNTAWNGQTTFSVGAESTLPRISVGNIDNDPANTLEVVFGTNNKLYVLKADGTSFLPNVFPKTIADSENAAPILADIDGDSDIEIIVNAGGKIVAYNPDGTPCIGWNLQSNNGSPFRGSPSVDDIDNDGLNEIVISSEDCITYVWETNGLADRIEWGSYRADTYNTGTYKKGCLEAVDLFIKDGPLDLGLEPNNFTQYMWTSEDIWIRNSNDNGLEHQNPEYNSNGDPNYIKIRVKNRGCNPSTGTETLTMNWAKANTNLAYPENWDGTLYNSSGFPLGEQIIGTPVTLPVIQPGEEAIITIPWIVPNPENYITGPGHENRWHFCLLATILGASDPLTHPYTTNPNTMVKENNNQAWKNIEVVDLQAHPASLNPNPNAIVAVSNALNTTKAYTLELVKETNEQGKAIFEEAEVTITMDDVLFNAWVRGGKNSTNFQNKSKVTENLKLVKGNNALLSNISMNANEYGLVNLYFNFLTQELTNKTKFTYHLIQKDAVTGEVMGGETFVIKKNTGSRFDANAGGDIEVARNQLVVLNAEDIDEPAIYNWYDSEGNLIYEGIDLQIPNAIAASYQLEVISELDGFKDYDEVNVTLRPSTLDQIAPNPASTNAVITYTLNEVNSAYIRVASYYENVAHNYILDVNSSQTTINVSGYNTGFYVVSLICDGQVVDSKTLIKQ